MAIKGQRTVIGHGLIFGAILSALAIFSLPKLLVAGHLGVLLSGTPSLILQAATYS